MSSVLRLFAGRQVGFLAIILCLLTTVPTVDAQDDRTSDAAKTPQNVKQSPQILGSLEQQPLPPIVGTTIDGQLFDLRRFALGKPVVIALTSTSCPLCKKYTPTLAQLERDYAERGVSFVFVGSIASDDLAAARQIRDHHKLQGPYLLDLNGGLLQKLNAKTTTEVFLLDSEHQLVYRGAVDDQYGLGYTRPQPQQNFLKEALDALLADQTIEVSNTSAPGCAIMEPKTPTPNQLEYYTHIFPIVQNNCVTCHRNQGVGPFPLETPEQLSAHAGMVRQVVEDRTMPPWFAEPDPKQPNKWMNHAALSDRDRQQLLDWIEGEQNVGPEPDNLVRLSFPTKWSIGEPDLIVKLPRANRVQANGFMEYIHHRIDLPATEDRWVQAVEIRPTSPQVVHHVLVYHEDRNVERPRINASTHFLAAYAPGNSFQSYPEGFAKSLPGNSQLIIQMHYTPNGVATTDQTEIAFKFAKTPPRNEVLVTGIADTELNIPRFAPNHEEGTSLKVPSTVHAMAFFPHMHLRGKAFRFELITPDNDPETILNIPTYDFNWQLEYRLQEPMKIPANSQIKVTGWFDNSAENPANPKPSVNVGWGDQTFNEMLIGYVEYYQPIAPSSHDNNPPLSRAERIMKQLDKNEDGKLDSSEVPPEHKMEDYDRDGDGAISLPELRRTLRQRNR